MSITVEGTVQKSNMGSGTWALVADSGNTYEIHHDAPTGLLKDGQHVRVDGEVKEDAMSIAMIGPVIEVKTFEVK
jgi:hypothetical protein